MNYTVNLGCWGSIFAVPTDVVDKYLKIAGSAQLKVLLYLLRHSGEQLELEDISSHLNMGVFDVKDCIEFWTSFDILAVNGGEITPAKYKEASQPTQVSSIAKAPTQPPQKIDVPAVKDNVTFLPKAPSPQMPAAHTEEKPKPEADKTADTVAARPLRPDPVYVAKRISEDKEIESLLNEAQYILGRPVSPNENAGMIMMHDNEGLPCEVILMLLTYGASNQKGMRQIEAMGRAWARDGILTLEQADEKIRELEESKEAYRKVQSILGLEFRKPSQAEEENYTRWLNEWKFDDDVIKEAYDKCVNAKGKYIPNYVNKILERWYQSGIRTLEQVRNESAKAPAKNGGFTPDNSRNSSFDIDELSSMSMFND